MSTFPDNVWREWQAMMHRTYRARAHRRTRVPADHPVRAIRPNTRRERDAVLLAQCGDCGRMWDDAVSTSLTPAPSARCPFEMYHASDDGEAWT